MELIAMCNVVCVKKYMQCNCTTEGAAVSCSIVQYFYMLSNYVCIRYSGHGMVHYVYFFFLLCKKEILWR